MVEALAPADCHGTTWAPTGLSQGGPKRKSPRKRVAEWCAGASCSGRSGLRVVVGTAGSLSCRQQRRSPDTSFSLLCACAPGEWQGLKGWMAAVQSYRWCCLIPSAPAQGVAAHRDAAHPSALPLLLCSMRCSVRRTMHDPAHWPQLPRPTCSLGCTLQPRRQGVGGALAPSGPVVAERSTPAAWVVAARSPPADRAVAARSPTAAARSKAPQPCCCCL